MDYAVMLERQRERREAVARGETYNTLFLLEHLPVITVGSNAQEKNLLRTKEQLLQDGVQLITADRGGDMTYHGPGQLVAYPILDLNKWRKSVGWYLRTLEEVIIELLAGYGLEAGRVEGLTGVWVNGAKIAAIGIGVRRWVTFHGIALNVNPFMDHFKFIVPGGIENRPITSLRHELGDAPPMDEVMTRFDEAFRKAFA
jgi:lipoate-protein ligase B